ncbi:hypothetical protein EDS67_27600 [candidate division KSB1 bacterium]|nr:MAG: hypothetical protein EDS67_27600 [candidate division KSB1 bacterium]MBC6948942.1 hypothetical protein [candidate division KSB1 bacterium]MCE7945367.1 hypothetical protein [Chlorobi bacterium CHB1]
MELALLQKDIIINIISSLLGAALSILATIVIRYFRLNRPIRKIWNNLIQDDEKFSFITTALVTSEHKIYTAVPSAEFTALSDLLAQFKKVYKNIEFDHYPSGKFPFSKIGGPLLLVGGPRHNDITKLLFERVHLPVRFDGHSLVDKDNVRSTPLAINQTIIKDYGIIISIPNPFHDNNRIILLAGCHAYGTNAAIRAMTWPFLKETLKHISSPDYAVVVEALVVNEFVSKPKIVKVFEITELVGASMPVIESAHPI